ncbi:MAG: FMN-binding protein [Treponema sp.]|nr:FMN-binding protein [Treponema sp.]
MKKDFILPVLVLSLICLFVTGALAVVNNFTAPVIELAAAERAAAARMEIIPQADGFVLLSAEGLPRTIVEIYRATNDKGYIFMISVPGYGGNLNMICGIDNDGKIIKTAVLSHTETKGMTDPVFSFPHESQYFGKDKNLHGIVAVTGATISSNAYKNGVKDAFTAFDLVRNK